MLQIKMCQYLLFPGFPSAVSIAGRKIKKITYFFFLPSVSKPAWARGSSDTQMSLWGGLWLGMNFPSLFLQGPSIRAFTLLQNGCLLRGFRGEGIMNVIWWNKEPGWLVAVVVPRWS